MSSSPKLQQWNESLPQIKSLVDSNNYKKLSSILPKLLNDNDDLPDTLRSTLTLTYIRSLLKIGSYQTAYDCCIKSENKGQHVPEAAYALYRLKRYNECLTLCQKASSSQTNNKELNYTYAQCLYRLNHTNKALDIYSDLFNGHQGEEEEKEEIATNALACLQSTYDKLVPHPSINKWIQSHVPELYDSCNSNYDLANNLGAFLSLSSTNTSSMLKAEQILRVATEECESQLKEDGLSKQEILEEALPIRSNLAYALLMNGKLEEADEILNHVLASTSKSGKHQLPTSLQSARASAGNNVTVRRISSESLFDSLKRLSSSYGSVSGTGEEKQQIIMSPYMMRKLLLNKSVLLSKMKNKEDECFDILKQVSMGNVTSPNESSSNVKNESKNKKNKKKSQSTYKKEKRVQEDNYVGSKMQAEIMEVELLRDKGEIKKAQDKLQTMINEYEGTLKTEIQLYQMQLKVMEEGDNLKPALTLLKEFQTNIDSGIQSKPALIATLISMYQDMNNSKEAATLLSNLSMNPSSTRQEEIFSEKAMGEYFLRMGMYQESKETFQKILDKDDIRENEQNECLALLVIATSYLDGEEAEEKLSNLSGLENEDEFDEEKDELTGEHLETLDVPWGGGSSSRRFLHQTRRTDRG